MKEGQALISAGSFDQALVLFDQLKQRDPRDPRSYIYSGMALLKAGRKKDASIELNQVLSLKVTEARDAMTLSKALADLGRLELASRHLAGELPPPPLYLRLNLAELTADDLWYLGDLHYQLEQAESAWELLELYALRRPLDPRINLRRGQILLISEKPEEAVKFLEAAVEADADSAAAHFFLGEALFLISRSEVFIAGERQEEITARCERAKELVLESVTIDPANAEYLHLLGSICSELGEHEKAVECLEQAAELIEDPVQIEFDLSRVYREVGERANLTQKMSLYRIHFDLNRAYRRCGRFEKAQEAMVRYRELYRAEEMEQERLRQLDELLTRGLQQAQNGENQAALETFLDAIQRDPDNWWVHNYLALLYMGFGAPGQALKHIQKMLDLDSDASDGHYFMALYWYHEQAYTRALDYAQTAKRLRPGKPELRMLLGDVLLGLDRPRDSLEEYDAARKLAPDREIFRKRYTSLSERLSGS